MIRLSKMLIIFL